MNLFEDVASIEDHLTNLTTELIRYPSHCDEPLKIFEVMNFIKDYFASDRLHISEHILNGLPALVITTEATKHPHFLLSGHIDVVAIGGQFNAEVKGDKLYGCGAMDMKGGIACMMAVMKHFANQADVPSLGLMITADEELGGDQTRLLLEQEEYMTDFCVVNEGRHCYEIVTREKGFLAVKLKLKGKSIHSAYPWKGRNVLDDLIKMIQKLQAEFPRAKDGWVPTLTLTAIQGGKQVNTIPDEAEAILSFRLTGGRKWNTEEVMRLLKKHCKDAEMDVMVQGEVFKVDLENKHLQTLAQAAREVRQKRIKYGENNGASDARFFQSKSIPTAILGPVGKDHHSPNEYVSIKSLRTHFQVLKRFIENDLRMTEREFEQLEKGK